jgi:hypothetical protein
MVVLVYMLHSATSQKMLISIFATARTSHLKNNNHIEHSEFSGSIMGAPVGSILLTSYSVSLGVQFPTFRSIVVPLSSGSNSPIFLFFGLFGLENEGSTILQNVGKFSSKRHSVISQKTLTLRLNTNRLRRECRLNYRTICTESMS